jgi:hypothetical protein
MNVEIWTEATQFPEKKYINGIFLAVRGIHILCNSRHVGESISIREALLTQPKPTNFCRFTVNILPSLSGKRRHCCPEKGYLTTQEKERKP